MKIIGMMIERNESWILPTTIPQQLRFVDELLVLDGNSTDDSVKILESHGKKVLVRSQGTRNPHNYAAWRQELLDWGRERKGTHFVCLDADEALSSDMLPHFTEVLETLKPGQKLHLDWISLWKDPFVYRDDGSVWATNKKDVIYCDDGVSSFEAIAFHEGRTPGPNSKETLVRVRREDGVVLHFQFVPFKRNEMKQAFLLCREYTQKTSSAKALNYKYGLARDTEDARCSAVPKGWIKNMDIRKDLSTAGEDYFLPSILEYFEKQGIEHYEPLQIWHIKKLHDMFVEKTGREPRPKVYSKTMSALRRTTGKILSKSKIAQHVAKPFLKLGRKL